MKDKNISKEEQMFKETENSFELHDFINLYYPNTLDKEDHEFLNIISAKLLNSYSRKEYLRMRKKIIKAMAQGDKKAFIIIYKKYANLIANYMNSIILSKEDVKKVTCDFFVNLPNMTQNRYFDEKIKEKFKTWILILAREQALDYMNNPIS